MRGSPKRAPRFVPAIALVMLAAACQASLAGDLRGARIEGLRSDLRGSLDLPRSSVALYHHEPHMGRVEGQIWIAYGTTTPGAITTHDGVPVAWLYRRP